MTSEPNMMFPRSNEPGLAGSMPFAGSSLPLNSAMGLGMGAPMGGAYQKKGFI